MKPRWEHFDHGADIGVRGFGPTAAEAFAQVATAMTAVIADPATIREVERVDIACEAADLDGLLYAWLNALVFEMATRRMLLARFEIVIEGTRLRAAAWGELVDPARHAPAVEVKGATYTALRVAREGEGWRAECVVDV